jgi:hypothetical protein
MKEAERILGVPESRPMNIALQQQERNYISLQRSMLQPCCRY